MKEKKWKRARHHVFMEMSRPVLGLWARLKYHAKVDKFKDEGKRNWLVLSNHQTDFDQFFVGLSFKHSVYYVAMEDIFSLGFISRVIEWIVAPIPIMKAATDLRAIKTCIRIAREGGNIALFPEGNRTYSGRTCNINPGVASLVKKLDLPIAIYRIEGGYGVKPRWTDKLRNGPMTAGVRRVIEPEEYRDLSKEELLELICRELYVDESQNRSEYKSRHLAEGIERALYVCPDCGITELNSGGSRFTCSKCGKEWRYLPDQRIEAVDGSACFSHVSDWYAFQEQYIRSLDLTPYTEDPVFTDTADMYEVVVFKNKRLRKKNARISIFADEFDVEDKDGLICMPFDDIKAMACIAGHKLNVFCNDKVYQIIGGESFNALKYCNIYYHAKFTKEEHTYGEFQFLGL